MTREEAQRAYELLKRLNEDFNELWRLIAPKYGKDYKKELRDLRKAGNILSLVPYSVEVFIMRSVERIPLKEQQKLEDLRKAIPMWEYVK